MNAGQRGAVTIATNMAGRGTDIKLGPGVRELGGLCVIGTERHESRRIDNQLRGRSGRQGDPGESQFYLSLEDDLMKRFGSERIKVFMERMNLTEEESVIKSKMLTRQVESAQKRVEGNNYDSRKQVLQYDDVMREQREIIYRQRQDVITADRDLAPEIKAMMKRTIERQVAGHFLGSKDEAIDGIIKFAHANLVEDDTLSKATFEAMNQKEIVEELYERALRVYDSQVKNYAMKNVYANSRKFLSFVLWITNGQTILMPWINCAMQSVFVDTLKTIQSLNINQKHLLCLTI